MKDTKRRFELLSFYNHTGIETHFEKMAEKGWLIERLSNLGWTYRRIEPKKLKFTITYYPQASEFDPNPSEGQMTFHDFCAHTGWQLACTWFQMQVFYNENPEPIPIETEPAMEVANIHKACKANYLRSNWILLTISAVMGVLFLVSLFKTRAVLPALLLEDSSVIVTGFIWIILAVYCGVETGGLLPMAFPGGESSRAGYLSGNTEYGCISEMYDGPGYHLSRILACQLPVL